MRVSLLDFLSRYLQMHSQNMHESRSNHPLPSRARLALEQ
jgi:hypothetical protein